MLCRSRFFSQLKSLLSLRFSSQTWITIISAEEGTGAGRVTSGRGGSMGFSVMDYLAAGFSSGEVTLRVESLYCFEDELPG